MVGYKILSRSDGFAAEFQGADLPSTKVVVDELALATPLFVKEKVLNRTKRS